MPKVTSTTQMTRMTQMSITRVPLPTIVVVDSDKSAEDQLRPPLVLVGTALREGGVQRAPLLALQQPEHDGDGFL